MEPTKEHASTGEPSPEESSLPETERQVRQLQSERRATADRLKQEGRPLKEFVEVFDNNYSLLESLYREKTGTELIGDPFEAAEHPIPISKSCSVVIPAYNSGKQLETALQAIQASSFNAKYPQQFEVVIVDDESPRVNIAQLVKDMGLFDLTVKVIRQTNGRENKGRYSGALEATGDVVLFTSQDIVYSPTMIEEYMKRHEVLGDITCFGLINEIDPTDTHLEPDQIKAGALGEVPFHFDYDYRVRSDGMVDCAWLKRGGNDRELPISTDHDQTWSWRLRDIPWSACVSAPRDVLLKTMCSFDERYKGYGSDEGQVIADLIAEGLFVIPNTGGVALHQTHTVRKTDSEADLNQQIYADNLAHAPKRQDPRNPTRTDANVGFSSRNIRSAGKEPVGIPHADTYTRAKTFYDLGFYDKAVELYQKEERGDFWYVFDRSAALIAAGGKENVTKAIQDLEMLRRIEPDQTWIHSHLAIAYGHIGAYDQARESYERAYTTDPTNWQASILAPFDGDPQERAEDLQRRGASQFLYKDKPGVALRYLEASLALVGEERMPWAVFDKGKALWKLGHIDDAIEQLQRAQQLMPHETWPDSQLGLVYESQMNYQRAKEYFESALQKSNTNSEAQEGLKRLSVFLESNENDLGLLDWDKDFPARRSSRLTENPNMQLDESVEVADYIAKLDPIYKQELEMFDQTIGREMAPQCRVAVTIPAYEEAGTIRKTLTLFLQQRGKDNAPLNPDLYELVVVDNHPESVAKDGTEDEIRRFMAEHPEIHISYAHKAWTTRERACVGNARKYATDLALLRSANRTERAGDLILVSFDADVDGLSEKYISDMVGAFDANRDIDAVAGKFSLPREAQAKPNIYAAQLFWRVLDRVIDNDAGTHPENRKKAAPPLVGRNAAVRASMMAAIGGYNPNAKLGEDLEIGWMINDARDWNPRRTGYVNSAAVITNPRRFLSSWLQGVPMINMYDNFHEDRDVRGMNNEELLGRIPDTFDVTDFEKQADALWQHYQKPQFATMKERFPNYFKRAMGFIGAEYTLRHTTDPDGVERDHVIITKADKLIEGLTPKNA